MSLFRFTIVNWMILGDLDMNPRHWRIHWTRWPDGSITTDFGPLSLDFWKIWRHP